MHSWDRGQGRSYIPLSNGGKKPPIARCDPPPRCYMHLKWVCARIVSPPPSSIPSPADFHQLDGPYGPVRRSAHGITVHPEIDWRGVSGRRIHGAVLDHSRADFAIDWPLGRSRRRWPRDAVGCGADRSRCVAACGVFDGADAADDSGDHRLRLQHSLGCGAAHRGTFGCDREPVRAVGQFRLVCTRSFSIEHDWAVHCRIAD